uniref:Uncharacterized protein n=1 Tax=Cyanothece sp. (strain PCC 7425 / ATCC 29141) TaxID=395961 RepID=B8HMV1_CYAP4
MRILNVKTLRPSDLEFAISEVHGLSIALKKLLNSDHNLETTLNQFYEETGVDYLFPILWEKIDLLNDLYHLFHAQHIIKRKDNDN